MLFDLEDYRNWHIIGPDNLPANQVNWIDPYTTARATRDAYLKAVNEYFLASQCMCTPEEAQSMNVKLLEFLDANLVLGPLTREFWNAMISLPIAGQLNVGDKFNVISVNINSQDSNYLAYPAERPQDTWWMQNYKSVAVADEYGEFVYTEMSQQLYDDHKAALVNSQLKVKEIIVISEGGVTNFNDYVAPAVPAWDSYPELSGYVRGTNNLTIKDAVVRLIDDAGENHDIVTDDNGYFKFTKEMFYNNIAFNHAATASSFNMFVLEHKSGSTASLYDPTNIFQNSFFGAENDREMTWSVQIRMGKPARRNFKIDFIPDYSNYPSFSGYVKDAAGNPIKDAFVMIKDGFTGHCIGNYKKPNGDIALNFKYNDFGTDRTILTDENGFYEYTSQMVGEWFNKQFMQVGEVAGNLGGRLFDEYFGSREDLISFYYSYTGRNLQYKESFFAILIPHTQDADSYSVSEDGTPLYDQNDYYASRFKYALNPYGEFQYQRIDLNAHYDIDVDVAVAANDEVRADKFTIELLAERKNLESGLSSQTYVSTTSGYFKVVYPATGESYVTNAGNWYNTYWHLDINYSNADDYKDFYVYSCDGQGRAMGHIKSINSPSFTKAIDLSEVKYLSVFNPTNFYGESIDFSGLEYLEEISLTNSSSLKNVIGLESKKAYSLYLYKLSALENIDISGLTGLTQLMLEYLPALQSLDVQSNTKLAYIGSSFAEIALDVSGLTSLNNITFNKLTMTSDDVDDLLIQLASMAPNQDGNNISNGNINIQRISRSSYSDDAYATLSQRNWNINLGGYFYDEEIIPNKLIIEVDPSLAASSEWMDMNAPSIGTTTGYWVGKLWAGQLIGNVGFANSYISGELRLGTTDARIEIFSCNEFGVPAGEITSFAMNTPKIKNVDTSELSALQTFEINYDGSGPYSNIESLDFTSNTNLVGLIISSSKVESIDLTGLTSLKNITFDRCRDLNQIIGFSTLSSLEDINLSNSSSLEYLSLAGFENMKNVYINEADLYDSTHVDTMLAELNANNAAKISSLDAAIIVKQAAQDAKQAELDVQNADYTILKDEMNQLIADGADQSLIDAKQAEIDASDNLNAYLYSQYVIIIDAKSILETEREIYSVGGYKNFNTNYMARTSASDADYESLLTYGWNLNIGSEFIAPYTAPVKGFATFDWTPEQDGNTIYIQDSSLKISTTTGYVKYVSSYGSGFTSVSNNHENGLSGLNTYIGKGILEFWSCDSHGRPAGSISGFGYGWYNAGYMKSFDISNLTEIKEIYFDYSPMMSSIDLSSNTNIESLSIVTAYQLQSIVGFANLVNLKDIYISDCPILDLPVDFTSMPNLQRINLTDSGINKNSRLNVSGLTFLQKLNISWTNLLSVDLDNALIALDAAGLNSESDFGYEGHLPYLSSNLDLYFGMGISNHAIADAAHASLVSKGWNLQTGNQIVDSIEDPIKGIARWSADAGWAPLGFSLKPETQIMAKFPDGIIQNVGSQISYSFNSSVPVEERFIEFWAVDNYGRPRGNGIETISDWWNTGGITSLEINNINSVRTIYIPYSKIQSLNLNGMSEIREVNLYNSQNLESIFLDSCLHVENIDVNECPNFDIDQLLISLDNSGATPTAERIANYHINWLLANRSVATSLSSAAIESLVDKRWTIDTIEPASAPMIFNVTGPIINFNVGTSTGYVKLVFPAGTEARQAYPDGWIQGHGVYRSEYNYGNSNYNIDMNSFRGQISIFSVGYNPNDGTYFDSGKVRYAFNIEPDGGDFNYASAPYLKTIEARYANSSKIALFAGINLSSLILVDTISSSSLDLSSHQAKSIRIDGGDVDSVLFNNSVLENIQIFGTAVTSIDLTGATMTNIILTMSNLETILLPLDALRINIENKMPWESTTSGTLTGELDFSGLESLFDLSVRCPSVSSIDITNLSKIRQIDLYRTSCVVIGLETTTAQYLYYQEIFGINNIELTIPVSMRDIYLTSQSLQSINITSATSSYMPNLRVIMNDSNSWAGNDPVSSIVVPTNAGYYDFYHFSVLPDISSFASDAVVEIRSCAGLPSTNLQVNLRELTFRDGTSFESLTLSGTLQVLGLQSFASPISLSNLNITNRLYLNYSQNLNLSLSPLNPIPTIQAYSCNNLSISGQSQNVPGFLANQINTNYCGGSMTISAGAASVWIGYPSFTSLILDNSSFATFDMAYGFVNSISMNSLSVETSFNIREVQGLAAIDASGIYPRFIQFYRNPTLANVSASLKNIYQFYMDINSTISSINLTDAAIATQLSYVIIESGSRNLTSSVVDSVINSVSATNRTGKTMRLRNMSIRTSASQTAYNKLIGQSWNMVNV